MASLRTIPLQSQLFVFSISFLALCLVRPCGSVAASESGGSVTIDSLRESLEKQEDFIVFSLIERARYPYNAPVYAPSFLGQQNSSLLESFVRETEASQAKYGRYQNPEELPFFSPYTHLQLVPPFQFLQILDPIASSVNVSSTIWKMYLGHLLQLITREGDDGNYQQTVAADLICLQALSKRIHYGRFVAEVKFRDAPSDYISAIHAKDSETLTELITSKAVEQLVIERVKKKAEVFGQTVTLNNDTSVGNETETYKVDPSVVSELYGDWIIPLTKQVEVEYLLRRLD